ncbi:glycosyltransferase [filamentous cyanobacterium LEGE 11480]|uniref:Glycosyltransferase n=1 Tax=Romeriopsis navalis LEGE 11480 TaxID=2777977 RepID=A0A928VP34_9CYAN|nr:glycosyltransferase [Romeriopsis navalis]MBE9029534.1 glycosyltransferase [Romeriopsis navalis LEGE 11480]
MKKILCINTGGIGNLHGLRMRRLADGIRADVIYHDLDKTVSRWQQAQQTWQLLRSQQWDLVYQEGSGIGAGASLIRAYWSWKQPFIVSSGDPIGGFFHVTKGALWGALFGVYEKALYRSCKAFVGWTPYLTGAALQLGARRGITIEGAVDLNIFTRFEQSRRLALKRQYGIPDHHLVCGVVGKMSWNANHGYCYGWEMVETLKKIQRQDISLLIVGDGTGQAYLERAIPASLKSRVVFTGRIPEDEVVNAMNAMDIGFVTQTLDRLGLYRLTTKLPEYLACGLGVAMSPIPGFYDYVNVAGWALPPYHPASETFHQHCADWLDQVTWEEIELLSQQALRIASDRFDYGVLRPRFQAFVHNLLDI